MKRIVLLLLTATLYAQTTIAVLDFDVNNVSQSDVRALSDRLRNELAQTGEFTVVERAQMEEILGEQGFQQSGLTSDDKLVEVGKLIGVEQMIVGSISKVGNIYTVSARIISVETATVLKAVSYDHSGSLDNLLRAGMREVALELSDQRKEIKPVLSMSLVEKMRNRKLKEMSFNKIVFISNKKSYITDFDGREYGFRLSANNADMPYWLPDGSGYIFVSSKPSFSIKSFGVLPLTGSMESGGSNIKTLYEKMTPVCLNPVIDSDMNMLYFEFDGTIFNYHMPTNSLNNITFSPTMDYMPAISPNDINLCWFNFNGLIINMNFKTSEIDTLFKTNQRDMLEPYYVNMRPRWSTDGNSIITANVEGLVLINTNQKSTNQITNDGGELGEFSVDGNYIIYIASNRARNYPEYPNKHIRIVSKDGGQSKLVYYKKDADIDYASPSPYIPK